MTTEELNAAVAGRQADERLAEEIERTERLVMRVEVVVAAVGLVSALPLAATTGGWLGLVWLAAVAINAYWLGGSVNGLRKG